MDNIALLTEEQLETIVGGVGWDAFIPIPIDQALIDAINAHVPDASGVVFIAK